MEATRQFDRNPRALVATLFATEISGKQLSPDQFGEWPGHESGDPYPEVPAGERLFDRQRVATIVTDGV